MKPSEEAWNNLVAENESLRQEITRLQREQKQKDAAHQELIDQTIENQDLIKELTTNIEQLSEMIQNEDED